MCGSIAGRSGDPPTRADVCDTAEMGCRHPGAERMDGREIGSVRRHFRAQLPDALGPRNTLIRTAHQLEQWNQRLPAERGDEPPKPEKVLAKLRNTLVYLNEGSSRTARAVL